MRFKFRGEKKYLNWGITAFCVIAAAIAFYLLLAKIPAFGDWLKKVLGILSPFVWGLVISYLLSPVMGTMERECFGPLSKKLFKKNEKRQGHFARGASVAFAILVFLVVLSALVYLILPQLYKSLVMIVDNSQTYVANLTEWADRMLQKFPDAEASAAAVIGDVNEHVIEWLKSSVLPGLGSVVSGLTVGLVAVMRGLYNLIVGVVVSAYILANKEKVAAGVKRILYSVFTVPAVGKIEKGAAFIDKTFMGFLTGKMLDSAIVAVICYVFCAIVKMPYALLISVIVGVTNMIPFFGPFIGAIPSALIILMVDPIRCLIFVIFIIVLQQVDGNIIGPKIIGDTIGINGFWIMFAIILGAGLFGFWGMLLGVPAFAVIYEVIDGHIVRKLKRSELPSTIAEYIDNGKSE